MTKIGVKEFLIYKKKHNTSSHPVFQQEDEGHATIVLTGHHASILGEYIFTGYLASSTS